LLFILIFRALIAVAQKVEHYEIAAYGTVRAYAEQLNFSRSAELPFGSYKSQNLGNIRSIYFVL
jgi:hypothetical protein